jgi:(1->4)-alpha-D-glucan 1-alpha-D-glucosylmutase
VDHNARAQALLNGAPVAAKLRDWRSGHLKQRLIQQALSLRAREPELFARGEYLPLECEGSPAGNVIAFLRRYRDRYAITVATRMPAHIVASAMPAISRETWKDTALVLPKDLPATWLDVFTENRKEGGSNRLHMADVLRDLPVALLYARTHPK